MLLISHRGNINGFNKNLENHPEYINTALNQGFNVEIDIWFLNNKWFLGHDNPQYEVEYQFLKNDKFWIHAKNGDAFHKLLQDPMLNVFWHTTEDWILTSKKYIWTYPNKKLFANSICVLPELGFTGNIKECHGICSDYIIKYKNI